MGIGLGSPRGRRSGRLASLSSSLVALSLVLCACGGGSTAAPPAAAAKAEPAPAPQSPPVDAGVAAPAPQRATSTIRGLQGTLNHDDVMQAMESQQPSLLACIETGRRSINFVNGDMHFEFKVDAEGNAVDVRATRSDVGHLELESCLTDVLAQARFPRPAGRTLTKDLSWGMSVDAAYTEATPIDAGQIASLLERRSEGLYEACELPKRFRYTVTTYFNKRGKAHAAGAVVAKGGADAREHVPCVVEQVRKWTFPKARRRSKVTYELKFQKAPSEAAIKARKKREANKRKAEAKKRKREANKRKAEARKKRDQRRAEARKKQRRKRSK